MNTSSTEPNVSTASSSGVFLTQRYRSTPRSTEKSPPNRPKKMAGLPIPQLNISPHNPHPATSINRVKSAKNRRAEKIDHYWLEWCETAPRAVKVPKSQRVQFALRPPCRVQGCTRFTEYTAQALCRTHYAGACERIGPPPNSAWRNRARFAGDSVGYTAAHSRCIAAYGPVATYRCLACPKRAEEWALRPGAGTATAATGSLYSTQPRDYMPLCRSCHRCLDRGHLPTPGAQCLPGLEPEHFNTPARFIPWETSNV